MGRRNNNSPTNAKPFSLGTMQTETPKDLKFMKKTPTIIRRDEIESYIDDYCGELRNIPLKIEESTLLGLMTKLKRDEIGFGPYPKVSFFEAANRIMTDLVILNGLKKLFANEITDLPRFEEFSVDFGHHNTQPHDVMGKSDNFYLAGEAFNVSKSFFTGKRYTSIKKLKSSEPRPSHRLVFCNIDSHDRESADPYLIDEILIVPIEVNIS